MTYPLTSKETGYAPLASPADPIKKKAAAVALAKLRSGNASNSNLQNHKQCIPNKRQMMSIQKPQK